MEAEIQGYLTEFGIIQGDIRNAVRGLNDEAANWRPLPADTNSIYAILNHLINSDSFWVHQVIRGEVVPRDPATEFSASGSLPELLARWERSWADIALLLGALTKAQLAEVKSHAFRTGPTQFVTVQWIVLHLITHHATHLGHIQLTRQLWEQRPK